MSKASRFGLRSVTLHFGMFDFGVECVVGPHAKIDKYIAWKFETPGHAFVARDQARGRCYYQHGYVPVIWLPRRPVTPREHGTLAHEALHAVSHLMTWAGIKFNDDTEEAYAHAVGFLVAGILEKLPGKA